uniref:Invertebrate defensins family profile domain-containing protein n=1 Tax=Homalodisca liturata TaxID=320908 RepID=A0A1B6JYK5_9HEMI
MYLSCVFVAALGVALGDPSVSTSTKVPPYDMACIMGEPTVSCRSRCGVTSWVPYCVGDHCLCRAPIQESHNELHKEPVDPPTTETPPSPTDYESEESGEHDREHHVWFLFVTLGRYFGYNRNETTNSTAVPDTTSTPLLSSSADVTVARVNTPHDTIINFQHVLGFLIVLLLCVLILLEVFSFYRKRKDRKNIDNLFKNVTVPNK